MRYAEVFDRAAPTYDRVGVDFFSVFGRLLVDAADVAGGEAVLDVGTGRGAVLGPAAEVVGAKGRAVGVDLAPQMVALTARDLRDRPQVEVRRGDAAALPAELGTFDAVLSSLVLFFTPDPAATLRHWAEFVRDGGRLGLVTFLEDADDGRFAGLVREWMVAPERTDGGTDDGAEEHADDGPTPFTLVRDSAWLDAALTDAGLPVIESRPVRHAARFADVEQWWAWAWSQGMRQALEMVPGDRHADFKRAAAHELDEHRLPDGSLGLHVTARITVARRR